MKSILKEILITIIEFFLKGFFLFPIHQNRISFVSFNGRQYSDSPKYIFKSLQKVKELDYVWLLGNTAMMDSQKDCKVVSPKSLYAIYMLLTSKVIVTNNYLPTYLPNRHGQIVLNTWHGGGAYKKCGMLANKIDDYDGWFFKKQAKKYSAFCCDSKMVEEFVIRKSFLFYGEILRFGLPRNQILQNPNENEREKIRKDLEIQRDTFVLLYAPTFRGNFTKGQFLGEDEFLDIAGTKEVVEKRFNKKCVVLFRGHHTYKKSYHLCDKDVTSYPDMQELLLIADALITDYSSCMWDMAVAKKPVFLYTPDFIVYTEKQGFYISPDKWPFPRALTNHEFKAKIAQFNMEEYIYSVESYLNFMGSYENNMSAELTCNWLLQHLGSYNP